MTVAGYSSRYADPDAIAFRQLELVRRWGPAPPEGARILELGCADGLVTTHLARAGYRVTAVDHSPEMLMAARERLERLELHARFALADVNELLPTQRYDVTLACMRSFFAYAQDPDAVLGRLAMCTRQKIIVDVNPRTSRLREAVAALAAAGFSNVARRALFVPQHVAVGAGARRLLECAELVPLVREAVLRRKFLVALKGEMHAAG